MPPDTDLAFSTFQAEVLVYITFMQDQRLAVGTDGPVIADITQWRCESAIIMTLSSRLHRHMPKRVSVSPHRKSIYAG